MNPLGMKLGIGLMCKRPAPGVSKTRLAAVIGAKRAAELAEAFLLDSAALARLIAQREHAALTGFFTPADAGEAMAALLPGWVLEPQAEGDLGARMGDAMERLFAQGASSVMLIGTDAPTLPPALIELMIAAVRSGADAACIPALDGGYCSIVFARPLPSLLENMPWSTAELLDATHAAAMAGRLHFDVLQAWHDVDEAEDLNLLRRTLDGEALAGCSPLPPFRASATRRALELPE